MKRAFKTPHELALIAMRKGRHAQALEHFEAAVAKAPTNTAVRFDFARFLGCLFRYREARVHLRAACEALPDEPTVRFTAAQLAAEERAPELALEWLDLLPEKAPACYQAAVLLERLGRLDESAARLATAERLAGETVDGRLLAARLAVRTEDFAASLRILDAAIGKAPQKPWPLAKLHYARGHAYDGLGEFDAAFAAWLEAKKSLQPLVGGLRADAEQRIEVHVAFAEQMTPERLAAWQDQLAPLAGPSPIMVTGIPRSGTTLLDRLLGQAGGFPSADENTAFRDLVWNRFQLQDENLDGLEKGLYSLDPKAICEALVPYQAAIENLAHAPEFTPHILDKNPQLLAVLPMLLRFLPHMPVVAIHRDPRDVLISFFSQPFGLNFTSVNFLSMETAAAHYDRVRQISNCLEEVLGSQMVVTRYEQLVAEPEVEIHRVMESLGVASQLQTTTASETRVSWSPTYAEVAKPVTDRSIGRWENYHRHLEPHLDLLTRWID